LSATTEERIAQGLALQSEGNEQAVINYFLELAQEFPDHPVVIFELGGAYDTAGQEAAALTHYQRAKTLGLSEENQLRLTVQMGSTLRNLERFEEAVELLREGVERFPEHRALRTFYALALYSNGQHAEALAEMIELALRAPGFYERYTRSLTGYAQALRE
jgi:tetratricopeptide (TPR) repeat protein